MVPELPPGDRRLRLLIDTDVATEIDDLYAIALALHAPERFAIEGLVATHFAQKAGRESIEQSYRLLVELLEVAGMGGRYPVTRGGDPLAYLDQPSDSPGARLIIERAQAGSPEEPLWVVGLGAATNLASALLLEPSIKPCVRYVFHARSEWSWPERNEQYNVGGDVRAARVLLDSGVPLVWFDTGQQLTCAMATTAERLLPLGGLPAYLHNYRLKNPWYQAGDKGFFDLGDISWMVCPDICSNTVVDTPAMDWAMKFQHHHSLGKMLRVHDLRPEPAWELFFEHMARRPAA